MTTQLPGVDLRSFGGHDVGRQLRATRGVVVGGDDSLGDRRVTQQDGLHVGRLDAVAADLQLAVDPAEKLQDAAAVADGPVPGAVHPRTGSAVGVGHETLGCQARAVEVASGQSVTAEVQLSRLSGGDRSQGVVEEVGDRAGVLGAERCDRSVPGGVVVPEGGVDGDLGEAVARDDSGPPCPAAGQGQRHLVGTRHDGEAIGQRAFLREQFEEGRRQRRMGDALFAEQFEEGCFGHPAFTGDHDESSTEQESHGHLQEGHVEAHRRELQDPAVPARAEPLNRGGQQASQSGGREDRPFGASGRSGCVDHVGRALRRGGPSRREGAGGVRGERSGVAGGRLDGHGAQAYGQLTRRPVGIRRHDQDRGRRVLDHEGEPIGRIVRIQPEAHAVDLRDRQPGHGTQFRPPQGDAHDVAIPDAVLRQTRCDQIGFLVESGIGQPASLAEHGGMVRPRGDLFGEDLRDEGSALSRHVCGPFSGGARTPFGTDGRGSPGVLGAGC